MGIYRFIYPWVTRDGLGLGGRQTVASSGYKTLPWVTFTFTPLTFYRSRVQTRSHPPAFHAFTHLTLPFATLSLPPLHLLFVFLFAMIEMAPHKPTRAGVTSEDLGSLDDNWTSYPGKSKVEDSDLAAMVLAGVTAEGQAIRPVDDIVPALGDGHTLVFTFFFDAGLRLPCDDFLQSVLEMYEAKIPQLSTSAIVKLFVFTWMCRTIDFAPTADFEHCLIRPHFEPVTDESTSLSSRILIPSRMSHPEICVIRVST